MKNFKLFKVDKNTIDELKQNVVLRRIINLPSTVRNLALVIVHPCQNLAILIWHKIRNLLFGHIKRRVIDIPSIAKNLSLVVAHPVRDISRLFWHPARNIFKLFWHPIRNILILFWHQIRNVLVLMWHVSRNLVLSIVMPLRYTSMHYIPQKSKLDSLEKNIFIMIACIPMSIIFCFKNTWLGKNVLFPFMPKLGNFFQHSPVKWRSKFKNIAFIDALDYPKLTIVTPSFQQGEFIGRTIDSVLDQNYPNLDFYIQDGGSSDDTVDVLKSYDSNHFLWESAKDSGQTNALNIGFKKSVSSDIMAYLNSDDLLLPGSIQTILKYFNDNPEIDVVYGNRLLIDEQGLCIGEWVLHGHNDQVLSYADYIPQETMFWRAEIWEKAGACFDEDFKFAMDWDLLLRFRSAGARMAHIPKFLGAFRIHEAQKTQFQINDIGNQEMERLRERELGYIPDDGEIYSVTLPYLLRHVISDFNERYIRKFIR